jgi:hypothetical protein
VSASMFYSKLSANGFDEQWVVVLSFFKGLFFTLNGFKIFVYCCSFSICWHIEKQICSHCWKTKKIR